MKITTILLMIALTFGMFLSVVNMTDQEYFMITNNISSSIMERANNINISLENMPELSAAINYLIYGILGTLSETVKWISNLVYSYPNAPYKLLMIGLAISMLSPIILVLFKLFLIIFLLIRNKIQDNKEKKRFKK